MEIDLDNLQWTIQVPAAVGGRGPSLGELIGHLLMATRNPQGQPTGLGCIKSSYEYWGYLLHQYGDVAGFLKHRQYVSSFF